jgi:acyl-CoA thioester hydrolase
MTVYRHRVRYHETDAQGFLFNARYLELADVAMTAFFRELGWPYPELVAAGADPSVVSAALTFRKPARFDDLLDVAVRCSRVGRSSFHLDIELTRDAEVIADIVLVYVNVDAASAASRPLPEAVVLTLQPEAAGFTPEESS